MTLISKLLQFADDANISRYVSCEEITKWFAYNLQL